MSPELLIDAALTVRSRAYAPYSGYKVGAAALSAGGVIYAGCNFENVGHPASVCAERAALACMIAAGERRLAGVAVATVDGGRPCGLCLQVISEFVDDDIPIYTVDEAGAVQKYSFRELMPLAFRSEAVSRTE